MINLAKHSIQNAAGADIHTGRTIERTCFSLDFSSEDQKEDMRSFPEKRKPNYKGK